MFVTRTEAQRYWSLFLDSGRIGLSNTSTVSTVARRSRKLQGSEVHEPHEWWRFRKACRHLGPETWGCCKYHPSNTRICFLWSTPILFTIHDIATSTLSSTANSNTTPATLVMMLDFRRFLRLRWLSLRLQRRHRWHNIKLLYTIHSNSTITIVDSITPNLPIR